MRAPGRAPLIPDFLWPWVGWLIGVLVATVATFGIMVNGDLGPWPSEQRVIDALLDSGIPRGFWDAALVFGSAAFFIAVVVALAIFALWNRSWPALVACATVPGAVVLVELILKPVVDRHYIWGEGALYYPSGTAAGVAAWTTLLWLLAVPFLRTPRARVLLALGLGFIAVLVAVAVVAALKHLPIDAIGGFATGIAVVLSCAAVIDVVTGVHRTRKAVEPVSPG
jgi:membrane-associated phospholipid phosphatase